MIEAPFHCYFGDAPIEVGAHKCLANLGEASAAHVLHRGDAAMIPEMLEQSTSGDTGCLGNIRKRDRQMQMRFDEIDGALDVPGAISDFRRSRASV